MRPTKSGVSSPLLSSALQSALCHCFSNARSRKRDYFVVRARRARLTCSNIEVAVLQRPNCTLLHSSASHGKTVATNVEERDHYELAYLLAS